eukprot:5679103-Pyramimonas_sp.AAC.1
MVVVSPAGTACGTLPMMVCSLPSAPCSSGAALLDAPAAEMAARTASTSAVMRWSSSDAVASSLCFSFN